MGTPEFELRFHPTARREVDLAFDWYLERSPKAAAAFLAELDHAAAIICKAPDAWPKYEQGSRRYVMRRFPFSVMYNVKDGIVEVMALAHHKRRPGYWHVR